MPDRLSSFCPEWTQGKTHRSLLNRHASGYTEGVICVILYTCNLLYNYLSGVPETSEDDVKLIKRLVEAGEIVGIDVLDHIIIGDKDYLGLKREELF